MNNYIKNTTVSIHDSLNTPTWSCAKAFAWECAGNYAWDVREPVRDSVWNSVGSPAKSSVRELIQEMN
jgi:hypothetical protein